LPAVFGLKGHSLVFETGEKLSAEAVFLAIGPDHDRIWFGTTTERSSSCTVYSDNRPAGSGRELAHRDAKAGAAVDLSRDCTTQPAVNRHPRSR
jgi:hypothetical protein